MDLLGALHSAPQVALSAWKLGLLQGMWAGHLGHVAMGSPVLKQFQYVEKDFSNIEIHEDCLKKLEHQLILEGISNQLFFSSAFDRLTHAHVETCGSNSQHIAEGEPRDPCFEKEAGVVQRGAMVKEFREP